MEKTDTTSNSLLDSAIAEKLKLSFEQRIEAHENALKLLNELKIIGENLRAGSEQAS